VFVSLKLTSGVFFVAGLKSSKLSFNAEPAHILKLIKLCGLESTAITIIKEAYNKYYLLLATAFIFD